MKQSTELPDFFAMSMRLAEAVGVEIKGLGEKS
jgi:hypothetical protein